MKDEGKGAIRYGGSPLGYREDSCIYFSNPLPQRYKFLRKIIALRIETLYGIIL